MDIVFPWYRLGYLIPHLHADIAPYHFSKVAPDGFMLVTAQWNLAEYDLAALEDEFEGLWRGVEVLAASSVDSIVIAGVPVASTLGRKRMLEVLTRAEEETGLTTGNDLEAHIAALEHLGAQKVAMATRWPDHVNQALTAYLDEAGVEVLSCRKHSRNMAENIAARAEDDHELLLHLGREAVAQAPDAEALLLPGGLGFVVYAAPLLEEEIGIPVLTNAVSSLWYALRNYDGLAHPCSSLGGQLLAGL